MESYSATKRNEVLIHANIAMNLGNIIISEISQTQKASIVLLHLYEISIIGNS